MDIDRALFSRNKFQGALGVETGQQIISTIADIMIETLAVFTKQN